MRLGWPIEYVSLVAVQEEAADLVKVRTTKPWRPALEEPGREPMALVTVVNDVKRPTAFRYLVFWRDRWWHKSLSCDYKDYQLYFLVPIEKADKIHKRAYRWAAENAKMS